jgi:hypothetical protein
VEQEVKVYVYPSPSNPASHSILTLNVTESVNENKAVVAVSLT